MSSGRLGSRPSRRASRSRIQGDLPEPPRYSSRPRDLPSSCGVGDEAVVGDRTATQAEDDLISDIARDAAGPADIQKFAHQVQSNGSFQRRVQKREREFRRLGVGFEEPSQRLRLVVQQHTWITPSVLFVDRIHPVRSTGLISTLSQQLKSLPGSAAYSEPT